MRMLGHAGINPTRGIRRNPGWKMTRFLSHEENACLHRALHGYTNVHLRGAQADTVRQLLLTGCSNCETMRLRW